MLHVCNTMAGMRRKKKSLIGWVKIQMNQLNISTFDNLRLNLEIICLHPFGCPDFVSNARAIKLCAGRFFFSWNCIRNFTMIWLNQVKFANVVIIRLIRAFRMLFQRDLSICCLFVGRKRSLINK